MRIKLGTLRRLIEENLDQMKLGVANSRPGGQAFGIKDDEGEGAPSYLGAEMPLSFDPGEEITSGYNNRGRPSRDMAGDPIVDDTMPFEIDDDPTQRDLAAVSSRRYAG